MYGNIYSCSKTEVNIAKLYLLFLTFRMINPFRFLLDWVGPLANSFGALLSAIGLIIWMQKGISIPGINKGLFKTILNSVIYLNFSSLVMSFVMYALYGDYQGDSPFLAIIPMILFYFQYVLMFLYNIRVFSILDYHTIVRQLTLCTRVLLVLAYIQIVVMRGIGGGVYDGVVGIIGGINDSSMLPKLSLTGSEGAAAGSMLGAFVFPLLYSKIIARYKNAKYELMLWLIPLYFTHSSTAFILFLFDSIVFLFLISRRSAEGKTIASKVIGAFFAAAISAVLLVSTGLLGDEVMDEINYLAFEKATDQENGSTAARTVPLIVNWGCFTEMPLFGVGNGLQGYFTVKYFPTYLLNVQGSDIGVFLDRSEHGISNGGCFFPGYFSGYGIAGLIVLFIIVKGLIRTRRQRAPNLGIFNEMFIIGAPCFIPMGMQGEAYCLFYAWFVLSIPFMFFQDEEIEEERVLMNLK